MREYLLVFLVAASVTYLLTGAVRRFAGDRNPFVGSLTVV